MSIIMTATIIPILESPVVFEGRELWICRTSKSTQWYHVSDAGCHHKRERDRRLVAFRSDHPRHETTIHMQQLNIHFPFELIEQLTL